MEVCAGYEKSQVMAMAVGGIPICFFLLLARIEERKLCPAARV